MIRFLQKDSRFTKSIFVVIISVACITMVITLVPGILRSDRFRRHLRDDRPRRAARPLPACRLTTSPTADVQLIAARMLQRQRLPDFVRALHDAARRPGTHSAAHRTARSQAPRPLRHRRRCTPLSALRSLRTGALPRRQLHRRRPVRRVRLAAVQHDPREV